MKLDGLVHALKVRHALKHARLAAIAGDRGLPPETHDRRVVADHLQEPVIPRRPFHLNLDAVPLTEGAGRDAAGVVEGKPLDAVEVERVDVVLDRVDPLPLRHFQQTAPVRSAAIAEPGGHEDLHRVFQTLAKARMVAIGEPGSEIAVEAIAFPAPVAIVPAAAIAVFDVKGHHPALRHRGTPIEHVVLKAVRGGLNDHGHKAQNQGQPKNGGKGMFHLEIPPSKNALRLWEKRRSGNFQVKVLDFGKPWGGILPTPARLPIHGLMSTSVRVRSPVAAQLSPVARSKVVRSDSPPSRSSVP